jgi:hypothetical protein
VEQEVYTPALLSSFYQSPAVRERIVEYCGASAWGIAGYGGHRRLSKEEGAPIPCRHEGALLKLLQEGADITRSFGDDSGNLLLLDVDYVNPLNPAEAYLQPELAFRRLEPVYHVVRELFAAYGLRPLVLMTGQGYHFVMRIARKSAIYHRLAGVGHVGHPLRAKYDSYHRDHGSLSLFGQVHDALGRMLELLCHRAITHLGNTTTVPVKIADVRTGEGPFICLDLSAYGDPIYARYARCAFSGHQKASMNGLDGHRGFSICLPRGRYGLATLLEAREHPLRAERMARECRVHIPTASARSLSYWLDDYLEDPLYAFHRHFDEGVHDRPEEWPLTYDRLSLRGLPNTVAGALADPNPELLKPANMQQVALHFWQNGWHPRDIAGLLRSKYERDYGWGDYWYRYDAAQRADFYVRILCGAAFLHVRVDRPLPAHNEAFDLPLVLRENRSVPFAPQPVPVPGP